MSTNRLISTAIVLAILLPCVLRADDPSDQQPAKIEAAEKTPEGKKELLAGEVVFLKEALEKKGIKSFDEMKDQVVLKTDKGELIPIVADWRGRAFFQDKRLRDRKMELVGTRKPGVPYLQVLMVYTIKDGKRMYTDYWCDICSIPMYEIKPCDCCQGDIRLRFEEKPLPSYLPKIEKPKAGEPPK